MRGGESWSRSLQHIALILSLIEGTYANDGGIDDAMRITLACLLGTVPAASILMMVVFYIYLRRVKAEIRQHAIANGIELDEEGWPVHVHAFRPNDFSRTNSVPGHVNPFPMTYQLRLDNGRYIRNTARSHDDSTNGDLSSTSEIAPSSLTRLSLPSEHDIDYYLRPSTATAH